MVACPMFSNVFPCFPMFSISMNYMRVGRRPLECTKASNLGAWTSRSRTPRIFTRQGSDWAGKSPNFTTASIYAGWWFGTFFIFPYIGNNHPNWLTNIFQRGWTHQPVYIYEYVYTVRILYIIYIYIIFGKVIKKSEMLNFRNVYCHMFDFQTSFDRTGGLPEGCLTEGANKIRHYENCKIKHTHIHIYIYTYNKY